MIITADLAIFWLQTFTTAAAVTGRIRVIVTRPSPLLRHDHFGSVL